MFWTSSPFAKTDCFGHPSLPTSPMCHHLLDMRVFPPLVSHLLATVLLQWSLLHLIFIITLMHRLFPCYHLPVLASINPLNFSDQGLKRSPCSPHFSQHLNCTEHNQLFHALLIYKEPSLNLCSHLYPKLSILPTSNFGFFWGQYWAYAPFLLSFLTRSSLWQLQILPQW